MEQPGHMDAGRDRLQQNSGRFLILHEIAFAANIAAAVACAFIVYLARNEFRWTPVNDSTYYFLRNAYRVNDLLHLRSTAAISTQFVARQFPTRLEQLGAELLIVLTTLSVAALTLFFLRLSAGLARYRMLLNRIAGVAALFAAPACYLVALKLTWTWVADPPFRPATDFWKSSMLTVFAGEIFCLIILLCISRRQSIPTFVWVTLFVVHYTYWIALLWPSVKISIHPLYARFILMTTFPFAGIVWLLYRKSRRINAARPTSQAGVGAGTIATSIASVALLCFLWLPKSARDLTSLKESDSLVIEMSRGACRGSCPIYTVTINGNGSVEYLGERNVRVHGVQRGSLSREQIDQVLQMLDRARFRTLEDRAFAWCFDSGSVAVSVSLNGETKRVISDTSCSGAKSGMQANFVKTSSQIDAIVGSNQWVSCDGPCRK